MISENLNESDSDAPTRRTGKLATAIETSVDRDALWYRRDVTWEQAALASVLTILLVGGLMAYLHFAQLRTLGSAGPAVAQASPFGPAQVAQVSPSVPVFDPGECIIPWSEVRRGGPPKDGIPALTDPEVTSAEDADFLLPDDRVIGYSAGGEARAYPLRILNWHEAVNDTLGGRPILVTYCPLCDSAFIFDREIGGEVREFGVSGLLYKSNVLLYDRQNSEAEESLWSQLLMKAVCGPAAAEGLELELLKASLVTWDEWRREHPETTVLSLATGHIRDYGHNPYAGYFADDRLMFHVESTHREEGLAQKERLVLVQAGETVKGYPLSRLWAAAGEEGRIEDEVGGVRVSLELLDPRAETARVTAVKPSDAEIATAYTFWFAFAAMHPEAEVFDPEHEFAATK